MIAAGFTWFLLIPGVEDDSLLHALSIDSHGSHMFVTACFVSVLLIFWAVMARRALDKARARPGLAAFHADATMTWRNSAELYSEAILGLIREVFHGKDLRLFFPFVSGLFIYIWVCNLTSLVPGFLPPTDNINTNVGMAVIVFFLFMFVGLSRDAIGFLKHMWGPVAIAGILLFPIEVISMLFRPVSLSLRLTGNMFGDHTVFTVMSGLLPEMTAEAPFIVHAIAWVLPVPMPFLALALLVSTIQALVFSLLSAIYVGTSVPHADEHGDH